MSTKVTIIGEEPTQNKIQFLNFLDENFKIDGANSGCKAWKNIELICRKYRGTKFDLMFAYHDDRSLGTLYIGYFNDGIV